MIAAGAAAQVSDTLKQVVLPVQNLAQNLPFGKIVFNPDWKEQLIVRGAENQRAKAVKQAQKTARLNNLSLPTLR